MGKYLSKKADKPNKTEDHRYHTIKPKRNSGLYMQLFHITDFQKTGMFGDNSISKNYENSLSILRKFTENNFGASEYDDYYPRENEWDDLGIFNKRLARKKAYLFVVEASYWKYSHSACVIWSERCKRYRYIPGDNDSGFMFDHISKPLLYELEYQHYINKKMKGRRCKKSRK